LEALAAGGPERLRMMTSVTTAAMVTPATVAQRRILGRDDCGGGGGAGGFLSGVIRLGAVGLWMPGVVAGGGGVGAGSAGGVGAVSELVGLRWAALMGYVGDRFAVLRVAGVGIDGN